MKTLIAQVTLAIKKGKSQRPRERYIEEKSKTPMMVPSDFQHLVFSHPIGIEGRIGMVQPWFELA